MTDPASPSEVAVYRTDRPALVYLGTDGVTHQLDRGGLAGMEAREIALCLALVEHASDLLNCAKHAANTGIGVPPANDFQALAPYPQGVTPL